MTSTEKLRDSYEHYRRIVKCTPAGAIWRTVGYEIFKWHDGLRPGHPARPKRKT